MLREWTEADLPALRALYDDPEADRWTPLESPFDDAAARRYLDRVRAGGADGSRLHLAVTTDGARPLGEVLLGATEPDEAEIGYCIDAAHRRRRLATRSVRAMTGHAGDLGLRRVVLRIEAANDASAGVARAAGFVLTPAPPQVRQSKGRTVELRTWERMLRPTG